MLNFDFEQKKKLLNLFIFCKKEITQSIYFIQNNTKISKTNTQILFLHNINIPKYKTKLQMIYWIAHLTNNKNI